MTDMKRHKASAADDFPSESGSDSRFKVSMRAENRWLMETHICHRGCHNGNSTCPENSLLAFETAVRKRLAVELDVQLLADGEIAVFHDSNTLRMTGVDTLITSCEAHQLRGMRLMGSDQAIPLLQKRTAVDFVATKATDKQHRRRFRDQQDIGDRFRTVGVAPLQVVSKDHDLCIARESSDERSKCREGPFSNLL